MTAFINPGSRIGGQPDGWTNTVEQAVLNARAWLDRMRKEGFTDIEIGEPGPEDQGRWPFVFRHTVTGVEVTLETHGISDPTAYEKQHIFAPRVYWNGSSSAEPDLDDFAAPGFAKTMTFAAVQS